MKKTVSAIIINHKTPADVEALLKSLHNNSNQNVDLEICVIDNQTDGTLKKTAKHFPDVNFIFNDHNEGFAHAANQGIASTSHKWIVFLNPDVHLTQDDLFQWLELANEKKFVASSPWFVDAGYHQPLPTVSSLYRQFSPLKILGDHDAVNRTLVGGCLLVKRSVIESLGGWDERFFLWFEDSDLTQRLLDADHEIGFVVVPGIKHQGGSSVKKLSKKLRNQIFFHSLEIFSKKHFLSSEQLLLKPLLKRYLSSPLYPILNWGAAIVVPNMRKDLLDDFLEINMNFLRDVQLVVVTSALSSSKVWSYRKKYPQIHFIVLTKPEGFAKTVNIGMRSATHSIIGTINDDVILNKSTLTHLIDNVSRYVGSINPIIMALNHSVESAGIHILKNGKALPETGIPAKKVNITQATNGACVLYSHKALNQVGLFDEQFGSYLEDIDLSLRMSRKGFTHLVARDSRVVHLKHQTSKRFPVAKSFNDAKNWWLVILKNWHWSDWVTHTPHILLERARNISGLLKSL